MPNLIDRGTPLPVRRKAIVPVLQKIILTIVRRLKKFIECFCSKDMRVSICNEAILCLPFIGSHRNRTIHFQAPVRFIVHTFGYGRDPIPGHEFLDKNHAGIFSMTGIDAD